jgi:ABC-type lipoprotein export system ATPase subunit
MKKTQSSPKSKDIIYFDAPEGHQRQNIIKNFLSYLKFNNIKGPHRFSYVQSDYELIESMTLRENIYLDTIPLSLTQSRESQFKGHMQKQPNNHLIKLLNGVDSLDSYPSHTDQRSRKILGLSKALMQNADYLFFDAPEKHLTSHDLELFIQALHFHVGLHEKIILLSSEHENLWLQHATKRVERDSHKKFDTQLLNKKLLHRAFLRTEHDQQSRSNEALTINLGQWQNKKVA